MKIRSRRLLVAVSITSIILLVCISAVVVVRTSQALKTAEDAFLSGRDLRFSIRPFNPVVNTGFEPVGGPTVSTQAAAFQGRLYLAGPAGLFEYDERGKPVHEYRVGLELPSSPVVALAQGTLSGSKTPELAIATADAGVLLYNGNSFRQFLPEAAPARSITCLLPLSSGHLVIGTAKMGLLIFDGKRFWPFHPTLVQVSVSAIAGSETDLWIGTRDRGVAHWHGGSVEWFDETKGLPDPHVYAVAVHGDAAYAGTPAGVAQFNGGQFARVLAQGAFVRSLLPIGDSLFVGTMDDGVLSLPLRDASRSLRADTAITNLPEVVQLFKEGDSLFALAHNGVYARSGKSEWRRVVEPLRSALSDRNVSSLAFDSAGHLWVGYFDRGLDIIDSSATHTRHIEDDHVFCVNRILPGAQHDATAVATANGLVLFDASGNRRQVLGRADGLIADHVTDVAPYRSGLALATPAGLTFLDSTGAQSLYAFHGLVNNHVYTITANGPRLLAGTLGGVSILENDQIRANYTTATSALKHNWITASVADGDGFWIGTYGAGIVHLDGSGHFTQSDGAGGELIINPNAMLATSRYVAAGSMGRGLYVMARRSNRWLPITDGLPSLNVTALAIRDGFLYVGTDNGLMRISEQRLER